MADLIVNRSAVIGRKTDDAFTAIEEIQQGEAVYLRDRHSLGVCENDHILPAGRVPFAIALNHAYAGQPVHVARYGLVTIGATLVPGTSYWLAQDRGKICTKADLDALGLTYALIGVAVSETELRLSISGYLQDIGWSPVLLFETQGRDGVFLDPLDNYTFAGDASSDIHDILGGPDWTTTGNYILRRDGYAKKSWQYVSGNRYGATVADFGTNCTIAYVDYTTGVVVHTGQTVSGARTLPSVSRLGPYLIVNSALNAGETELLTTWLTARRPGNWFLGTGAWDDNGVWDDAAYWEDAA